MLTHRTLLFFLVLLLAHTSQAQITLGKSMLNLTLGSESYSHPSIQSPNPIIESSFVRSQQSNRPSDRTILGAEFQWHSESGNYSALGLRFAATKWDDAFVRLGQTPGELSGNSSKLGLVYTYGIALDAKPEKFNFFIGVGGEFFYDEQSTERTDTDFFEGDLLLRNLRELGFRTHLRPEFKYNFPKKPVNLTLTLTIPNLEFSVDRSERTLSSFDGNSVIISDGYDFDIHLFSQIRYEVGFGFYFN